MAVVGHCPRRRRRHRDPPAERRRRRAHVALDLRLHPRARLRIRRVRRRTRLRLDGPGAANRPDGRIGSRVRAVRRRVAASCGISATLRGWRPLATWSIGFALCRAGRAREGAASAGVFRGDHRRLPRRSPRLAISRSAGNTRPAPPSLSPSSPPGRFRSTGRPIWHAVTATWAGLATDRVHLRGLAEAPRHLPARNVRLPAAVVADPGGTGQARDSRSPADQ